MKFKTSVSVRPVWFALSAASFLLCSAQLAQAAPSSAKADWPQDALRVTEITESSHPFQTLYCAREPIQVRFIGDTAEIIVNGERRVLRQAIAASGARYVVPGDESTELWSKGPLGTLTWSGQELPVCAPAGTLITPFKASGNEPFWTVTYDGWGITLTQPGKPEQSLDAEIVKTSALSQTLQAGKGPGAITLTTEEGLCVDNMTGMPHPQKVTLTKDGVSHPGCGGRPARLLEGVVWKITHMGATPAQQQSPAFVQFLANNQVAGSSGCNRFFGQYELTGESLTFKGMGSTRMACEPALMAQEDELLKLLSSVNRFSFKQDSVQTVQLHSGDTVITAEAQPIDRSKH